MRSLIDRVKAQNSQKETRLICTLRDMFVSGDRNTSMFFLVAICRKRGQDGSLHDPIKEDEYHCLGKWY